MTPTNCKRGHARIPENLYWNGRSHHCRICNLAIGRRAREQRKLDDPFGYYLDQLRKNAKRRGIEFAITRADVEPLPEFCPVLGIKIDYSGNGGPNSNAASVDRSKSNLGYVAGNVVVMSARANMLKNDATPDELFRVAEYVRKVSETQ